MTCSSNAASRVSVSVARNAATSSCGRSRTKPTVSTSSTSVAAAERQAPNRRIERREQLILGDEIGARQRVEQRRLAGVRVADERDRRDVGPLPFLAAHLALPLDALEAVAQVADPPAHEPPVGFELRLAGTPQADAALLPLEVGPAAHEPRREVLVLRELDLELAFERRGALREDVEDQAVAVEHARLQRRARGCAPGLLAAADSRGSARLALPARARAISSTLPLPTKNLRVGPLAPRLDFADDVARRQIPPVRGIPGSRRRNTVGLGRRATAGRVRRCAADQATYLPGARERHLVLCLFLVHGRDAHVAGRHYGRNRVLVDHLADAIA